MYLDQFLTSTQWFLSIDAHPANQIILSLSRIISIMIFMSVRIAILGRIKRLKHAAEVQMNYIQWITVRVCQNLLGYNAVIVVDVSI